MSIYSECLGKLLSNQRAAQEELKRTEAHVLALYEAFVATIGAPVEAVSLLNSENTDLQLEDLVADRQNTSHFRIQLDLRVGDQILQSIGYTFAVTPAIGSGVVVKLNGKQIQGRISAIEDQVVVNEMVAAIHRLA